MNAFSQFQNPEDAQGYQDPQAQAQASSTANLEQQASQGPQALGKALQAQQQAQQAQQQPSQGAQGGDPLSQILQQKVKDYQDQQAPPVQGGRIKQLLTNFAGGVMNHIGFDNAQDRQNHDLSQILQLQNAKTNEDYKNTSAQRFETVPYQLPDGSSIDVTRDSAAKLQQAQIAANQRLQSSQVGAGARVQAAQIGADAKPPTEMQTALDAAGGDPQKALQTLAATQKAGKYPPPPPGSYIPVTDAKGNTTGWVNPKGNTYKPAASIPGVPTVDGTIPNKPTAQMRNVGAQAEVAVQGIPQVVQEIGDMKDELGPVAGRWNEFMQGNIGMDNPKFAGLRADLLMVSSAVALAHARGRLPENLRQEFDNMINSPKQTPENIQSVLGHILPWMQRMQNIGQPDQQSGQQPPPSGMAVSLSAARALPFNKGKSDADIRKDIESKGHQVID